MRWEDYRRSDNVEDRRDERGGVGTGGMQIPPAPGGPRAPPPPPRAPPADQTGQFVAAVLAQTEDVWKQVFKQSGQTYREPRLVLFANAVQSACGFGRAATGPFYCPQDQRVYLDISFFS